jgi:hypothetical protein
VFVVVSIVRPVKELFQSPPNAGQMLVLRLAMAESGAIANQMENSRPTANSP